MNSAVPGPKRPAPCRYFFNSGTCFYGDECQFLHDPSRLKQRQFAAGRSTPPFDPIGEMPGECAALLEPSVHRTTPIACVILLEIAALLLTSCVKICVIFVNKQPKLKNHLS
jgi:hypothetical protein